MESIIFENIPEEIFLQIASNLVALKDKLSARLATIYFHRAISFKEIKPPTYFDLIYKAIATCESDELARSFSRPRVSAVYLVGPHHHELPAPPPAWLK